MTDKATEIIHALTKERYDLQETILQLDAENKALRYALEHKIYTPSMSLISFTDTQQSEPEDITGKYTA